MSAASPLPTPYPNASTNAPGGYDGGRPPSSSGERAYPHVHDLLRKASTGYHASGSPYQLIGDAERALGQARFLVQHRQPDQAYVEYVRASDIVVDVIPRNKGWPDLQADQTGAMQRYRGLVRQINAMGEQFASIKNIIVNNNKRSGVQPGGAAHVRTESAPVNGLGSNGGSPVGQKVKPSVSPKPEKLHGRALSNATSDLGFMDSAGPADALGARFRKLRMSGGGGGDAGRDDSRSPTNRSSVQATPVSMPSASDYGSRFSFDSETASRQLHGPRGMPNGNGGPPLPAKMTLDTNLGGMPKAPSPTYSPARNMQTTGNIAPPRHTARSLATNGGKRNSSAQMSSASAHAPNGFQGSDDGAYFPRVTSTPPPQVSRRKSVHVPKETYLSPERLYDYLDRYNMLLIDVRPREDFDQGHIFARNVICVDPLSIAQGISAEELLERMVLSPEPEQDMFMNRDTFDLVVYYDNDTQSDAYLSRPATEGQAKLKYLHEALYDFNHDKPLQRPPILLMGGVDAWADLVGNQALMTSNTAARIKQGRPIQRRSAVTATGASQLRVNKRRLRDYNPLDEDEEQKWRERARAESIAMPVPPDLAEEGPLYEDRDGRHEEEPGSAIQEFLERFPDAGNLDQHAFGPLQPSRAPPEIPAKVPMYPPKPEPSTYPQAPRRPMPAAPKRSYTGVSERSVSQNAPAARSTQMVPYISPKYLAPNLRLPRTGLQNFGATCYMNSTLQALSATTPLSIFFLDDAFRGMLQKENWKGTKGVMPELYSNLLRSLWSNGQDRVDSVRPSTFRGFCGRLKKEWASSEQQDAKEFFDFLVDCLHEDLNGMWARTPLRALTEQEEAKRERMPKLVVANTEWGRYTHREQSFLTSLFAGQHLSRLRCAHCGFTSTTYEAFYSISIEIPHARFPTLDDCLRSYCSEERLTGAEQVHCSRCKQQRDFIKQITLTRAPPFLVIHFKRFSVYRRGAAKITAAIDFPLENLDLEPYMLPPPTQSEADDILRTYGQDALRTDPSMTPPYTYDAYGVVRHIGSTLASGHYTALTRDRARGVWRCFNDDRVGDFVPGRGEWRGRNDLRNEEAYIVFYQRTGAGMGVVANGDGGGMTGTQGKF